MRVNDLHERRIDAPAVAVGARLDELASRDDRLWPRDRWPPMRLDRPLAPARAAAAAARLSRLLVDRAAACFGTPPPPARGHGLTTQRILFRGPARNSLLSIP
jgi:hypothetical protein